MKNLPIQLEDYKDKNSKRLPEGQRMLIGEVLKHYGRTYYIILRQLGKEEYKKSFEENQIGEEKLFELLNLQEKNHLEEIAEKLGAILKNVSKRIK